MFKKIHLGVLFAGLAAVVAAGIASAASSEAPLSYSGKARTGYYCNGENTTNHPVGEKLAEMYEVEYQEIMDRFCLEGYGFGEISLAYYIAGQAGVDPAEVFDLRAEGMGWGKIMQNYGLHGKSGKAPTTNGQPQGQSTGNGNGNGHGRGNGQGNGKALGRNR